MNMYIAEYEARHKIILIKQHSCFIWRQEGDEMDIEMLKGKINRESSIHFFNLTAGPNYKINIDDIEVNILKTEPFNG